VSSLTAGRFELRTSAGSLAIDELTGSGSVSASAGDINIRSLEIAEYMDISTSAGTIRAALAGDPSLDFTSRMSAGSLRTYFDVPAGRQVDTKIGDGPYKRLDVSASAGTIVITRAR